MMRHKKTLFFCTALFLTALTFSVSAEAILNLRISQTYVSLPEVTVFFEVTNELNELNGDLSADQLLVDVADNPASVAPFNANAEGVAYLFLVDTSKNMTSEQLQAMQDTLKLWIMGMTEQDKAAIVSFGEVISPLFFTGDKAALANQVDGLQLFEGQHHLFPALNTVLPKLRGTYSNLPARRAVVVLGSSGATFGDSPHQKSLLDLLEQQKLPIYVLDFAHPENANSLKRKTALESMQEVVEKVAGEIYQISPLISEEIYQKVQDKIRQVYMVKFAVNNFKPVENELNPIFQLHITIIQEGQTSYINPIILPELNEANSTGNSKILNVPKWPLRVGIIFVSVLMIIWGGFIWFKKFPRDEEEHLGVSAVEITKIVPGNAQSIGAREEQQDAFGFSEMDNAELVNNVGVLAVLADGMGGLAMGREVSNMAVRSMLNEYIHKPISESIPLALRRVLYKVNHSVLDLAKKEGLTGNVGSTIVAVVIDGDNLYWISVGDSRIYLYRKGMLTCLTEDHIYAKELNLKVSTGQMGREEAANHPERGALTSYLGISEITEVDQNLKPFKLLPGDRILLCSDGLYGTLAEAEIRKFIEGHPQQAAEALVKQVLACQKKFQDNVTVAILACE